MPFEIKTWMWIVGVLAILVLWFIATYNTLVRLRNKVREAFSTIEVYLQKRFELVPNLVETVKGYASHEKETLEAVIKARSLGMGAVTDAEKLDAANQLTSALNRLMVVVEQYPDLKAEPLFQNLSQELSSLEEEIAEYRKYYNAVVNNYNNKVEVIPSNIVASIGGFKPADLFKLPDQAANVAPKVQF